MNRRSRLIVVVLLGIGCGGCAIADPATAPAAVAAGTPPSDIPGQRPYQHECLPCHAAGATGSLMLAQRLGADRAVLAERRDLAPDYIRTVVRAGRNGMMPMSRVEVTDADLDAIVAYLTRQ